MGYLPQQSVTFPQENHLSFEVNGVLHHLGRSQRHLPNALSLRPGIVHRLDVGTTGVIAVAKTVSGPRIDWERSWDHGKIMGWFKAIIEAIAYYDKHV